MKNVKILIFDFLPNLKIETKPRNRGLMVSRFGFLPNGSVKAVSWFSLGFKKNERFSLNTLEADRIEPLLIVSHFGN